MNYLIRTTSSGIVMVEADTYLKAVGKLRNIGIVGLELVGAFQPYRVGVTQLTLVGDNILCSSSSAGQQQSTTKASS